MKKYFILLAIVGFVAVVGLPTNNTIAQTVAPTPAGDRLKGIDKRKMLEENSLVSNVEFRNLGPSIMSGRCVDVDVNPNDPTEFYVAYASGGLWHTTNNGQSFTPIFDHENVMTIGDIAVDWNHGKIIWVGTGEANSSRSSYAGIGIYKSSNAGKTWIFKGLAESHHIGKILLNPEDTNTVFVAALGHLYSYNKERGVYKTTDGGKNWKQVLYVNDTTGAVDVQFNPSNAHELFAIMWQRDRKAWNFSESGIGSGIYKSTDDGNTWALLTKKDSGFPMGAGTGRIGLSIFPSNTNIIYAILDNENHKPKEEKKDTSVYVVEDLKNISKENFLLLNDDKLNNFLKNNNFPEEDDAAKVKDLVKKEKIKPSAILDYLNDANNSLFSSPVIGEEVYKSINGGKSWTKTSSSTLFNLCYTYGYYFGKIFVSPFDENKIIVCGVPMLMSQDGGKTFKDIDGDNTHGDHHVVWFDAKKDGHFIIGNDGGVAITYDDGTNWFKCNTPAVGQFYSVNVDDANPYNVYGGLQDNGTWTGPSDYTPSVGWLQEGQYAYKRIYDGDGMQVQIDTRDKNTIYAGFQFGNYGRINKTTGENEDVKPNWNLGEEHLRFNWQSPILLSPFNQDILYFGTNKLFRSMNQGKTFTAISPDLTNHDKIGDVPFNTITTITESPKKFGKIYIGTDDGNVQFTENGGSSWVKISSSFPQELYVSRVIASAFSEDRIYVSLNGYRNDNFAPYLFMSDDDGKNWTTIGTDLPMEPINVVKEDPVNENIIYVGTDNGLYVSLNKGKNFMAMNGGVPRVAIHDIAIQKTANEIVLGTHGRSLYAASLNLIQQLNDSLLAEYIHAFDIDAISFNKNFGKKFDPFGDAFTPEVSLPFFVKHKGITKIEIKTDKDFLLKTITDTSDAGINFSKYDLTMDTILAEAFKKTLSEKDAKNFVQAENRNYYLPAGTYTVEYSTETGNTSSSKLIVKSRKKKQNPDEGVREKELESQ